MPRTIADYMNEVQSHEVCRGIGPNDCEELTWKSVKDICSEHDLAFMIGESRVQTEASYNTGTVAVTNGNTAIALTGGTWSAGWTNRRIRIKGRTEFYDITVTGAAAGTLGTAWQGATGTGLTYEMYRDIYSMPSDCDFAKEVLLWDVTNGRKIDLVDYAEFRETKRESLGVTGDPTEAARLGLTAAGLAQIELGPLAPASARTILVDYYKKPTKPTALNQSLSPLWPEPFEEVIWLRTIWKYADRRGHPRRFECQQRYDRAIFNLNAKFDGGNEMRRRLRTSADTRRGGMTLGARWTGS